MPFRDPDPTDPNILVGVVLQADAEATRDMAYVFAEEFARLGHDREQILRLFKNPYYAGAHGTYRNLGEEAIAEIVDECVAAWGRTKIIVQDVQTVQSAHPPSRILPGGAGEERGGGENDWNVLNDLNPRGEESEDG